LAIKIHETLVIMLFQFMRRVGCRSFAEFWDLHKVKCTAE